MSADHVIADLDGARLLNPAGNRNAPYLAEQAAEKLIRAVLTSEGIQALPPTAAELSIDLDLLAAVLSDVARRFGVDLSIEHAPATSPGPIRG